MRRQTLRWPALINRWMRVMARDFKSGSTLLPQSRGSRREAMVDRARYRALQLWCVQVAGAFYTVAVAGKLFGNPLAMVIDVVLPLQIFLPLPLVATFAVRSAVSQAFSEQSRPIVTMLSCLLSPCAAMVGYEGFAYLYELGPAGESAIYTTIADAISRPALTATKFAHDHHIPYSGAFSLERYSLVLQTILAAMSFGFALLSTRAVKSRATASPHAAQASHLIHA